MSRFAENMKQQWRESGIILQILIINIVIFFPLNISANFNGGKLIDYFAVPLDYHELLVKPWTIITCMFSHFEFSHILYNMLWFYVFGRIFIVVTGFHHWSKSIFIYIASGLFGTTFLYIVKYSFPHLFPSESALGASDAVLAFAMVVGFYSPNYEINFFLVGPVKAKWAVAFLFVMSTVVDLSDNAGGKISHLGGAIFGMIYGLQLKKGNDLSAWFTKLFTRQYRSKLKVVHQQKKRGFRDEEYNTMKRDEEQTLNHLLDKINKSGYESLSKTEKETLHLLSKKK